ncbi:hypothetical protein [Tenacibaculum sp. 190524A02b]|uniref:hypothetical protein n=1 Tax=Tenacibaculum vairaonense TaxID=3137860 RepID=UPI0031FA8A5C
MKRIVKVLFALFSRRVFITKEDSIGFSKKTTEEVRKEIDKKITKNTSNALQIKLKEEKSIAELDKVLEKLRINPNYYTIEEIHNFIEKN